MSTLVCVPIMVDTPEQALADALAARDAGADAIEFRIDPFFPGAEDDDTDRYRLEQLRGLLADAPLPVVLTCRLAEEGGEYDGDETDRVSLFERLCIESEHPPAFLDVELAAYRRSANIRQKINLCVRHPKQEREVATRLILSMHDFDGRPADLSRRLADAWAEPAASVVKFAFRARSIRDNLEVFEITKGAPKPSIGLCMGEYGLMSRVLAPKFNGFLTFASLRDEAATAPGQPTVADLLGMYRFRSIGPGTRLYGVVGWPVAHSMSPLIHNAGFEAVGHDGVYLPMPVADSDDSLKATLGDLTSETGLGFAGASVTLPHKERLIARAGVEGWGVDASAVLAGAANTLSLVEVGSWTVSNTDLDGAVGPLRDALGVLSGQRIALVGAGGVARAIASGLVAQGATVVVYNRTKERAEALVSTLDPGDAPGKAVAADLASLPKACAHAFVNATSLGMDGGPDPEASSVPVASLSACEPDAVFFDTVYNPIETPMLRAAREHGFRTIDGVQMFVRQAAAQFELWTGKQAPAELFDRLVRERLSGSEG